MNDRKCAICEKTRDLFSLEMDYEGEKYTKYVCGNCWEVIAAIANKAIAGKISKLQDQIDELRNGEEKI